MWFQAFKWLKLFKDTGFYVRLLGSTLRDVLIFLILFFCILFTFGDALMIMNEKRSSELYKNYFDISFFNSIFNQYLIGLGDFDIENYELLQHDWFVWVLFIFMTFLTQIVFLNMLIAIMGNTYAKEMEFRDQSALKEKIDIISDYVVITRREENVVKELAKFIFAITPATLSTDEDADWEGSVTTIKNAITDSNTQVKQVM